MPSCWSDPGRGAVGLTVIVAAALHAGMSGAQSPAELSAQRAEYDAVAAKSIMALQPFRRTEQAEAGGLPLDLVSINPAVNAWFVLTVGAGKSAEAYHLQNPDPKGQTVRLDGGARPALVLNRDGQGLRCSPWAGEAPQLDVARASELPYAPICDGRLYLRNRVSGSRTNLERTTDFLRDHVWGGEAVVRFVRDRFLHDRNMQTSESRESAVVDATAGPAPAEVRGKDGERPEIPTITDFALDGTSPGRMAAGAWYPVTNLPGVFVSAIQPRLISDDIPKRGDGVKALDAFESKATDFFVAFDLSRFDLGFGLGTDHPRLDWSPRPPDSVRVRGLPGPDGVDTPDPLVMLGMVSPALTGRTIATFTGGFKRSHGAFKWGPLSTVNGGSHYGFIEEGAVLSKLQPGLSTIFVLDDGTVGMKTWKEQDNALLPLIRFARQNGVPLLETDPATGRGVPGKYVSQWLPGNWSGSANAELRTLRAGACMVGEGASRYLIYGYFSTATPSAMTRGFQAYGCRYAMLLDMNALEHTYLALYTRQSGNIYVEHIVPGMGILDKKDKHGNLVPRFLGFPDNRDFFYLTRKEPAP